MTIIHIAGPSGSGKTYIAEHFAAIDSRNSLNIVDLDEWIIEFVDNNPRTPYKFIKFMTKKTKQLPKDKINLLIGFADMYLNDGKNHVFDVEPDYKFYVKITPKKLFMQYNQRTLDTIHKEYDTYKDGLKKFIIPFLKFRSLEAITDHMKSTHKVYVSLLKYNEKSQQSIINAINRILSKSKV